MAWGVVACRIAKTRGARGASKEPRGDFVTDHASRGKGVCGWHMLMGMLATPLGPHLDALTLVRGKLTVNAIRIGSIHQRKKRGNRRLNAAIAQHPRQV